jgi:hypothetical protein
MAKIPILLAPEAMTFYKGEQIGSGNSRERPDPTSRCKRDINVADINVA